VYPRVHAERHPDKAALVMARTGETVTYRELDDRSNQLAHVLWDRGLRPGDRVALLLENHIRFMEIAWACQRSGLLYTPINFHLTVDEASYIARDSEAKALIASAAQADTARAIVEAIPEIETRVMLDGASPGFEAYEALIAAAPAEPLAEELEGIDMLYSSGTTGRPKGVKPRFSPRPMGEKATLADLLSSHYAFDESTRYLSPAPMYHGGPFRYILTVQRLGGTAVVMDHFDPEESLRWIEQYGITHSQWVPTMFIRMLRLPDDVRGRYNLSSHRYAIHSAAPCPVPVKEQMIEWWGPVIYEYYSGTEGSCFCSIGPEEWLAHKGSVGQCSLGELHVLDEDGTELPPGQIGAIYVAHGPRFEYHNDPEKTAASRNDQGWSTFGDVGHLDADGYLFLTDRKAHMIISGGVNIYPQEIENVLGTHPSVGDVAVFGIPNDDFGEEVKAVVEPARGAVAGPELEAELMEHCRVQLAGFKCPRSIDFEAELPRLPTGKLQKHLLKERYRS
jgi:long-chain acyl-CoA synthetase